MTSNAPCATSGTATSNIKTVAADYLDVTTLASINGITLAPNPNKGSFKIFGELKNDREEVAISILDLTGRVIYSELANNFNGKLNQTITIAQAVPGYYILRLVQGTQVNITKFIIEK
jgi:hypothetical protein